MTARYESISRSLREQIRSGALAPGELLPSEVELMEQFGCSRMTIRQAKRVLEGEGLLEPRHGVGVFVRSARRCPECNGRGWIPGP